MITEDFVSYETAKLLKEKGFDGECREFWKDWNGEIRLCSCNRAHIFDYCHNSMLERYNDTEETNIAAPTLQMAMKWLREKEIFVEVTHTLFSSPHKYQYSIFRTEPEFYTTGDEYKSYEEACEAAIKYCLENLI